MSRTRLTAEGYASFDTGRLSGDFLATCKLRGMSPSRAEGDIGLASGTASRLLSLHRTRAGKAEPVIAMNGLSLVLLCRWMRVNPCDYVRVKDAP
jgi:hypothetical protein